VRKAFSFAVSTVLVALPLLLLVLAASADWIGPN
jgi:Flp pilus assembly protein TadG